MKSLLGTSSPEALLNTLWLKNTLHFGLCGCQEHRDKCWGMLLYTKQHVGKSFWSSTRGKPKLEMGQHYRDVRPVTPKMFATDGSEKILLSVVVYKHFAERRPQQMMNGDSPFYLAVDNLKLKSLGTKTWFKGNAVGINKINSLMKTMAQKAGLENNRLRNHSGRKTMIQSLGHSDVSPTHIVQLAGHGCFNKTANEHDCPKFSAMLWPVPRQLVLNVKLTQPIHHRAATHRIPVSSPWHCSVEQSFKEVTFQLT